MAALLCLQNRTGGSPPMGGGFFNQHNGDFCISRDKAAAQPPLTPPAPRLCSVYPGNVSRDFFIEFPQFAFITSKNCLRQEFLKILSVALHSSRLRSVLCTPTSEFDGTQVPHFMRVDIIRNPFQCSFKERANYVRFPSCIRTFIE